VGGVGSIAAEHFLVLANTDTLALDGLDILEATEHIVVDLENNLDVELGTLLDGEGLVLEAVHSTGGRQLDHDVGAALGDQGQRLDDALGVVGLADGFTGVQTQRGLPAVQGFIILVWGERGNC
jgi:hypothetical protein